MNCPFYGRAATKLGLVATSGNQCALITHVHAPCYMEIDGTMPDWNHCGRNPAINGTFEYGIAEARRRMELKRRGDPA